MGRRRRPQRPSLPAGLPLLGTRQPFLFEASLLRAAFRTSRDALPGPGRLGTQVVAMLRRAPDGRYRASFTWPDSAVYATFAVESPDGTLFDDNERRLWHLFVVGPNGRATLDARRQRTVDQQYANWEEGLRAAQSAATAFPNDAAAQLDLLFFQTAILSGPAAERVLVDHRARLATMDATLRPGDAGGEAWGALAKYAEALGDSPRRDHARVSAASLPLAGPYAVDAALALRRVAHREAPVAMLAFLDSTWSAAGPVHPGIVAEALSLAQKAPPPPRRCSIHCGRSSARRVAGVRGSTW